MSEHDLCMASGLEPSSQPDSEAFSEQSSDGVRDLGALTFHGLGGHARSSSEDDIEVGLPPWYDLQAGAEFSIGRQNVNDMLDLYEPTLSNVHVSFRSIVYDVNDFTKVAPMLYVQNISMNGTVIRRARSIQMEEESIPSESAYELTPATGPQLLEHGDELFLSANVKLRYRAPELPVQVPAFTDIQNLECMMLDHMYHVTERRIGVGSQGSVLAAVHLPSRRQVACKVIDQHSWSILAMSKVVDLGDDKTPPHTFKTLKQVEIEYLWRMEAMLKRISQQYTVLSGFAHPNIISVERVFITTHSIYIMQELITGGDLFSFLHTYPSAYVEEVEAAVIIRQLLDAVDYLHRHGIVHRDIKPENVLMTSLRANSRVILTDFDQARPLPSDQPDSESPGKKRMQSVVGTHNYAAPEIYGRNGEIDMKGYTKAVDLWSVGAITAMLLTGNVIFVDLKQPDCSKQQEDKIMSLAAKCRLEVIDDPDHPQWSGLSRRAKSFVRSLHELNEDHRLSARDALRHPWFTCRQYAERLEEVYQSTIKDWRASPVRACDPDYIDTTHLGDSPIASLPKSWVSVLTTEDTHRSRHFHSADDTEGADKDEEEEDGGENGTQ